ncbi:MAG TPA: polysaccharide biosynthesis tyrosine autokinase [Waterburya sp.]|jgi:capsular exopolysaccharide synthesis family protein
MEAKHYVEDIDFQKYWLILRRHWLPATSVFLLTVLLVAGMSFLKKAKYQAEGRLLLKKKNVTSALITGAAEKIGQLEPLNFMNSPLDTEVEVIRSIPLLQKTIATLNLKDDKGAPLKPEDLLKQLKIKGIKGTDVLQVTLEGKNPYESAQIVNQLMNVYLQNNVLANRAEAIAARKFITEQLPKSEFTVRQAEAELRTFKEKNNIVALEEEEKAAVNSIADLDKKIDQTQTEFEGVTARALALQSKTGLNPQQAMALNSLRQSPAVQDILGEVQKLEGQLAAERARFQDDNPSIINLKFKLAAKKTLLRERIAQVVGRQQLVSSENLQISDLQQKLIADQVYAEVQHTDLANQIAALSRAKSAYKLRATMLPRLQQTQRDLERKVEAAQSAYQVLLKNFQEIRIAENQNMGNASVIAYAQVPERPISARKIKVIALGVVVGSLCYVITAFLVDLMDPSIKTVKEVRELFNYTWLGMIPDWQKKGLFGRRKLAEMVPQLPVRDAPHSVSSESYRMLQANLEFLSPDKELKVIVVTSSVSKEGKSTASANLAIAMAQLGRRVLLIDADLRHPMQHHIWDLANAAGLSDVIVNQAEFSTAVRAVMDNLDVLPSGVIPPNPLTLLDSKRMASLINEFSQNYNFVILDAPPLVLAADALSLSKMTDGILLVARPGVLDRVSAAAAKEFLAQSGQEILGLVVNGVRVENEPDSYFHHAKTYYTEELTASKLVTSGKGKNPSRF